MKPQEDRSVVSKTLARRLVPWLLLVLLVFIIGLVVGTLRTGTSPKAPPVVIETEPLQTREVILYFASADGQALIAESRQIRDCAIDEECLRETVQSLISGPQGNLEPILPAQASLLNLTVNGSLVQLDFSRELVTAHPGGTQSELLTIYGLVDTLTVNFPHLREVQILVEGAAVQTLKGHVDLRQPIYPDFSLVEEGPAPIGTLDIPQAGSQE